MGQAFRAQQDQSTSIAAQLSSLQDEFYNLHRQGKQNDAASLKNFSVSLQSFISGLGSKKADKDYGRALAFCKAWQDWLGGKGISLQAQLGEPDEVELQKAKNYIKCVELYKLGHESVKKLAEAQNKLAENRRLTEGEMVSVGMNKKENLGYFIRSLLSDPNYSFSIIAYEEKLKELKGKKEILDYVKQNKYQVLAQYLINPNGTFGEGGEYSFSAYKEFGKMVETIIDNSQNQYVNLGNSKHAISLYFRPRRAEIDEKVHVPTKHPTSTTSEYGTTSSIPYKISAELQTNQDAAGRMLIQDAINNLLPYHQKETTEGKSKSQMLHQLKYSRKFTSEEIDAEYSPKFAVRGQVKKIALSMGYDYDNIVKRNINSNQDIVGRNRNSNQDELAIFFASEEGQDFVKKCNQSNIVFTFTGSATMELIYNGKNLSEFLDQAEKNYQLALKRASKCESYLQEVNGKLIEMGKDFIKYETRAKVQFFQENLPNSSSLSSSQRAAFDKFLKANKISGFKSFEDLLSKRYGFNKQEAADNFNNFMHDLENLKKEGYLDAVSCYSKLNDVVLYNQQTGRYSMKADENSISKLSNYFMRKDASKEGMRDEKNQNAFVVALTARGGRSISSSIEGKYALDIEISQPERNTVELSVQYSLNGIPLQFNHEKDKLKVFFYGKLHSGEEDKLYEVPSEYVKFVRNDGEKQVFRVDPGHLLLVNKNGKEPEKWSVKSELFANTPILDGRFIAYAETSEGLATKPVWSTKKQLTLKTVPTIEFPKDDIQNVVPLEIPRIQPQFDYQLSINFQKFNGIVGYSSSLLDTFGFENITDLNKAINYYYELMNKNKLPDDKFKNMIHDVFIRVKNDEAWLNAFDGSIDKLTQYFSLLEQGKFQEARKRIREDSELFKNSQFGQQTIQLNNFKELSNYIKFSVRSHHVEFTGGIYQVDTNNNILLNVGIDVNTGKVVFLGQETNFERYARKAALMWFNVPQNLLVGVGLSVDRTSYSSTSPATNESYSYQSSTVSLNLNATKRFEIYDKLDVIVQAGLNQALNMPLPPTATLLGTIQHKQGPVNPYVTTSAQFGGSNLNDFHLQAGVGADINVWEFKITPSVSFGKGNSTQYYVTVGIPIPLVLGGGASYTRSYPQR
ncbi:MAG: hypothetical protein N3F07_00600 [Candidatus Micrarchaeota archaeon]|nr:hypothetical protein [Candidatus Micrarchaeota archaeon]